MAEPAVRVQDDVQELVPVDVRPRRERPEVGAAETRNLIEDRVLLRRNVGEGRRQRHAGTELDRPLVKLAQQFTLDLDELDAPTLRKRSLVEDLVDRQRDGAGRRGVQFLADRLAVTVALRPGKTDRTIEVHDGDDGILAGFEVFERRRTREGIAADHQRIARLPVLHIPGEKRFGTEPARTTRRPLEVALRQHHVDAAGERLVGNALVERDVKLERLRFGGDQAERKKDDKEPPGERQNHSRQSFEDGCCSLGGADILVCQPDFTTDSCNDTD